MEETLQRLTDIRRRSTSREGRRSSSQTRRFSGSGTNPSSAPTRLKVYKSNSRSKWVIREIAALEFLLGIPLEAERDIVRKGWMQQQGIVDDQRKQTDDEEVKVEVLEPPTQQLISARNAQFHYQGKWWEKWIANNQRPNGDMISRRSRVEDEELEQPHEIRTTAGTFVTQDSTATSDMSHDPQGVAVHVVHAPGRRLQGDEAIKIQLPIPDEATTVITRKKNIARISFMREWEIRVAHGIGEVSNQQLIKTPVPSQKQVRPPMLDGRLFFSAGESYPIGVFSLLRYEPKKEEAARRRQKLEARGGGGTQFFIMPVRDWRGISYRALLPPRSSNARIKSHNSLLKFDRFALATSEIQGLRSPKNSDMEKPGRSNEQLDLVDDEDHSSSDSDDEDDTYVVGLLDDPEMVQGRHRNVMIGDRVTGPIVSSTIQFVKPTLLKADLNKQFRERFDGWEPPKSQRKYIGARVVDGIYTLMDPGQVGDDTEVTILAEDLHLQTTTAGTTGPTMGTSMTPRKRLNSTPSMSTSGGGGSGGDSKETIRMPPSLTLSKIRSIKQQTLLAAVQAKLEISSVALSIVYFERLCLDCRVDKTNRRLSFAACLLLSMKMNEAHVELVTTKTEEGDSKTSSSNRMQSLIRPAKKSGNVLASLLEFFTQEWNLSLKHLFAAEWGVFAALQFRLHAKPSQVAFHFRRLLKAMDWNPRAYLGPQMHTYWLDALAEEEYQRIKREEKRKERQERKERKRIVQLQRELHAANRVESVSSSIARMDKLVHDEKPGQRSRLDSSQAERKEDDKGEGNISPIVSPRKSRHVSRGGLGRILTHFGKRTMSSDKLESTEKPGDDLGSLPSLPLSPSMPIFPTASDLTSDVSHFKVPLCDGSDVGKGTDKKVREPSSDDEDDGWVFP